MLVAPGGETFIDTLIGVLGASCAPVIVVLGHEAARIRDGAARGGEAVFVFNEGYAAGQLSSLQCGLRAVPAAASGVLFMPVDLPLVRAETVAKLVSALPGAQLAIPRFEGRHGHPVCCSRELIPEFLALAAGAQARDVIHAHAARYVDVDDPGVVRDIDDREAYRSLIESAGSR